MFCIDAYQLPTLSPMYGSYGLADDMEDNWDSDLSERQPQTEETNMNVQASNVLESTPEGKCIKWFSKPISSTNNVILSHHHKNYKVPAKN